MPYLKKILLVLICAVMVFVQTGHASSYVEKFPAKEVTGTGPLPYNFRMIDWNIFAGGHPLNPRTGFGNTNEQTIKILDYLRSRGIRTVIDLENTLNIQDRYKILLEKTGIKRLHIPINSVKMPTKKEWEEIKAAMKNPVYIHCKWGADRTGAIIGRYLVEFKKYSPEKAYKAVISGGADAGPFGGLKTGSGYEKLKDFIMHGPRK